MKRGDIHTVAGGKDYAGKPRPAVIVQDDNFDVTESITICAFTTDPTEAPLFRLRVDVTSPPPTQYEHFLVKWVDAPRNHVRRRALRWAPPDKLSHHGPDKRVLEPRSGYRLLSAPGQRFSIRASGKLASFWRNAFHGHSGSHQLSHPVGFLLLPLS